MNIAILDDELHCVESLIIHINALYPQFKTIYKSTNPRESIQPLKDLKPDLLFLDVEMPGMNGFEFLEQFSELPFDVIFTTAYSQYAVKAFKAQAVNYLLKPIDENELKSAVDSWVDKRRKDNQSGKIDRLLTYLKKEGLLKSKIAVPVSDGLEFIEVNDIVYCQSQNNYTTIYLIQDENILISKTLKEVESALEKFFFVRTHQSYLINPNYMRKYVRNDGGYIIMNGGKQIPVGNSKKALIVGIFEAIRREGTGEKP